MTNWEKFFGTPELLVDHLLRGFHRCPLSLIYQATYGYSDCGKCKHYSGCYHTMDKTRAKYALEWLQEECE